MKKLIVTLMLMVSIASQAAVVTYKGHTYTRRGSIKVRSVKRESTLNHVLADLVDKKCNIVDIIVTYHGDAVNREVIYTVIYLK